MPKRTGPLTDKEAAFVREYLVDKSKAQAALRAGYSPRSAARVGSQVYAKPHVKAAIAAALADQAKRTLITADRVLLDINDLADKAGKAGEYSAAIKGKELIGKHYKLFTEKHEHGGIGGGPVLFQISEKEAEL
jgi:phage terminase small subunit